MNIFEIIVSATTTYAIVFLLAGWGVLMIYTTYYIARYTSLNAYQIPNIAIWRASILDDKRKEKKRFKTKGERNGATDLHIKVGKLFDDEKTPVVYNQQETPNLFIGGRSGMGKTSLIANLMMSALEYTKHIDIKVLTTPKSGIVLGRFNNLLDKNVKVYYNERIWLDELRDFAELARARESKILAASKKEPAVFDVASYNKAFPDEKLRYQLMIVDEAQKVVDMDKDTLKVLEDIAATGRSSGMALILATQHIARRTFSAKLLVNFAIIALQLPSAKFSTDLIGQRGAETLPRGQGYFSGDGEVKRFLFKKIDEVTIKKFVNRMNKL